MRIEERTNIGEVHAIKPESSQTPRGVHEWQLLKYQRCHCSTWPTKTLMTARLAQKTDSESNRGRYLRGIASLISLFSAETKPFVCMYYLLLYSMYAHK
jgi:hypothetical protein